MSENLSQEYDLFISYRSESSGRHAAALRDALYAFDKRHSGKGLRIFLDRISLRNGPLDEHIKKGLGLSRHLVVLVDSTTRKSPWVDTEIRTWLKRGGSKERLFLVRTDQVNLRWGKEDFESPEQLPEALSGLFKTEQKYTEFTVSPRRAKDIDLVPLYSSVTGQDPDDLNVDELRFRSRQRVRNNLILAVLSVLLVGAIIATIAAVRNAMRAQESSQQAQADALAAEGLLTLPVLPERAVDMIVKAGRMGSGTSIRSALIAAANETGPLTGTMSLAREAEAKSLTGMSVDPTGRYLTAWGPGSGEGKTAVATWLGGSGDLIQSFQLDGKVVNLIEVPGNVFLACTDTKALKIDWRTHEVEVLFEKEDVSCTFDTALAGVAVLAVASYGSPSTERLFFHTIEGVQYQVEGDLTISNPQTAYRFVEMKSEGDSSESTRIRIATPTGLTEEVEVPGYVIHEEPDALTVKQADGSFVALVLKDGKPATIPLQIPTGAHSAVTWLDNKKEPRSIWVTSTWTVGTSFSDSSFVMEGAEERGSLALYRFGYNAVLVKKEQDLFRITVGENSKIELTPLGKSPDKSAAVHTCGDGKMIVGNRYLTDSGSELSISKGDLRLIGCHVVELGPPVKINGVTLIPQGVLSPMLVAVSPSEGLFVGRSDGTIGRYSFSADAVPWHVDEESKSLSTRDGASILWGGSDLQITSDGRRRSLKNNSEEDWSFSRWLLPRPDGSGGVVEKGKEHWEVRDGSTPKKFETMPVGVSYRPGPGFETDRAAAERQQLVCDFMHGPYHDAHDCLTNERIENTPAILEYRIGPSLGRIVAYDGARISITTWSMGDNASKPKTRYIDLPGGWAERATLSLDGKRIAIASSKMALIQEFSLNGEEWVPTGEGYSLENVGASAISYSPDSSLLLVFASSGKFELFDSHTKRKLGGDGNESPGDEFKIHYLSVVEDEGYLVATLSTDSFNTSLRIPIRADILVDLLCGVHRASACDE